MYYENEEAVLPCSRSDEISAERDILGRVIAMAAQDLKKITEMRAWKLPTHLDHVQAASAARFFLGGTGTAMIQAIGLGPEAIKQARDLALGALDRMGIDADAVLADSDAAWEAAVDHGSWPRRLAARMGQPKHRQGRLGLAAA